LKRSLEVIGQATEGAPADPEALRVGQTTVWVEDSSAGAEARKLASAMIEAGATEVADPGPDAGLRISILTSGAGRPRTRDEDLASHADFVLGSARPAFARHLVAMLRDTWAR